MGRSPKIPKGMVLRFTSKDGWSKHVIERAKKPCDVPALKPDRSGYIRQGHKVGNKIVKTMCHRDAWEKAYGAIPKGWVIDHLCLNKGCRELSHLECVTHKVNTLRATIFITHCPQGHKYTPDNLRRNANGGRECIICRRAKGLEAHYAKPGMGGGKGAVNKEQTECPTCGGPYTYRTGKERGHRRCMACYNRQAKERYHTPEGKARQAEYTYRYLAKKLTQ